MREPRNTILILISDLYEGGVESGLLRRAHEPVEAGVRFIALLALSDEGAPASAKTWRRGRPGRGSTPAVRREHRR